LRLVCPERTGLVGLHRPVKKGPSQTFASYLVFKEQTISAILNYIFPTAFCQGPSVGAGAPNRNAEAEYQKSACVPPQREHGLRRIEKC